MGKQQDLNRFGALQALNQEKFEHLIVTNNAYFGDIGLDAATTGVYYEYFRSRDTNGQYLNQKVIKRGRKNIDGENTEGISKISFLFERADGDNAWGTFEDIQEDETEANNFSYRESSVNNWSYVDTTSGLALNDEDIPWSKFNITSDGIPNRAEVDGYSIKTKRTRIVRLASCRTNQQYEEDKQFFLPESTALFDRPQDRILSIIVMNEFLNDLLTQISLSQINSIPANVKEEEFSQKNILAMLYMLRGIRQSKESFVKFNSDIHFNTALADGKFQCPIDEKVEYNLHLFPETKRDLFQPVTVPRRNMIAEYKVDPFGRSFSNKIDGGYSNVDTTDEGKKKAGDINWVWNNYLQKFEAGTMQMHAKCVEDIPVATSPSVDTLKSQNTKQVFSSASSSVKYLPATGTVLPISMQNGNPKAWSPNYEEDNDCRGLNLAKQEITAFNLSPKNSYEKDDVVLINQIEGVWCISPLDAKAVTQRTVLPKQWSFASFMATREGIKKGRDLEGNIISVEAYDAERVFHKNYYYNDPKNTEFAYNDQFSTETGQFKPFKKVARAFQHSSFDYMDNKIYGTRQKNAIGTTIAYERADGKEIPTPQPTKQRNAAFSGPFWGCVFPDGYVSNSQLTALTDTDDKDWKGKIAFSGESFVNYPYKVIPREPFDDEYDSKANSPFSDGPDRHDGVAALEGDYSVTDPSNDNTWYFQAPRTLEDAGSNNWRGTSPDMFYMLRTQGQTDLRQLPADIALLDHPNSQVGQPFYPLSRTDHIYPYFNKFEDGGEKISDILNICSWIRKEEDVSGGSTKYGNEQSVFGLTPINRSKIQFRPLKMEAYNAYWYGHDGVFGDPSSNQPSQTNDPFGEGMYAPLSQTPLNNWNDIFGQENLENYEKQYNSWRHHMSRFFQSRGTLVNFDHPKMRERINFAKGDSIIGGIVNSEGGFKLGPVEIPVVNDSEAATNGRMHDGTNGPNYWNIDPQLGDLAFMESELFPAGHMGSFVVGVTTAICTIGAVSTINFTTSNEFGMESVTMPGGTDQHPSYGNVASNRLARNTIGLHATVYQQHDRKNTLFDPEYFAVHHFNNGASDDLEGMFTGDSLSYYTLYEEIFGGSQAQEWPQFKDKTFQFMGIQNYNGEENIVEPATIEEVRAYYNEGYEDITNFAYTIFNGSNFALPLYSSNTHHIGSDAAIIGSSTSANLYPQVSNEFSLLNVSRVGKLLPFRYVHYPVRVPHADNPNYIIDLTQLDDAWGYVNNGEPDPGTEMDNLEAHKLIFTSTGSGYAIGDIVGNIEYGLKYEVHKIGEDGSILALKFLEDLMTKEIPESIFQQAAFHKTWTGNTGVGVKISNFGESAGTGFEAWYPYGVQYKKYGIDQKPRILRRDQRISAKTNSGIEQSTSIPFGVVSEVFSDTIILSNTNNVSSNGLYDVFLFFANDPQFVWNCSGNGRYASPFIGTNYRWFSDSNNTSEVGEQFIELNITVT